MFRSSALFQDEKATLDQKTKGGFSFEVKDDFIKSA